MLPELSRTNTRSMALLHEPVTGSASNDEKLINKIVIIAYYNGNGMGLQFF